MCQPAVSCPTTPVQPEPGSGENTSALEDVLPGSCALRQEHTGPTAGRLKHLGRLGRGREQICLVCSAASEAFGAVRKLSALIQHAKSEEEGCRTSEPWDSLIGCEPAEWPF